MNRELEVKWVVPSVISTLNRLVSQKWANRSLEGAWRVVDSVKEKNRLNRTKSGEFEGLRFQINGERVLAPEDHLHRRMGVPHSVYIP